VENKLDDTRQSEPDGLSRLLVPLIPVISWLVLELHGLVQADSADGTLICGLLWLILTWFIVSEKILKNGFENIFWKLFVDVLYYFSILLSILWFARILGLSRVFSFLRDDVFGGWNGLSILCAMVAGLLLSPAGNDFNVKSRLQRVVLLGLQPFLNGSRGAILLLGALAGLVMIGWLMGIVRNRNAHPAIRFFGLCLCFGAPVAISILLFPKAIVFLQTIIGSNADLNVLVASGSDIHSAYSRYFSAVELIHIFFQSPFIGSSYAAIRDVKVMGYSCHTLWAIIVSSYGLLGLVLCLFPLAPGIFRWVWSGRSPIVFLVCLVSFVAISSMTNDFWLWYLVIALFMTGWSGTGREGAQGR
jgi:hypothetical protein